MKNSGSARNTRFRIPAMSGGAGGAVSATSLKMLVLLFAALSVCPVASFAQDASAVNRFHRYESAKAFKPKVLPPGLRSSERVQVVVTMSEDSVATVRERAVDHTISLADRRTVEQRVSNQHSSIESTIQARGGKVLRRFHNALNGVKIEIERSQIPSLATLPGVVEVVPVGKFHRTNVVSVPFIGAPLVWQGTPGFRGEGVKIAVIDTGIDYTHANFGGPGTVAAFLAADATSTQPADPALFGPAAPKVKGGTDLVGDDYNADPNADTFQPIPHPDPNPLDCGANKGGDGHGSHVSGTAAGFGVANGGTYGGPYNSAAYQQTQFAVGPGVAPKADLYMVRVFGCAGSSDVVVDAIEWAVQNDMDVISMSLGSDFGPARTADAIAAHNATKAGITVVAASGNAGPGLYITSTPASGNGVISVAAMDSTASFPGAAAKLNTGQTLEVQNSNGAALPGGALAIVVLRNAGGGVSLGCDEAEYVDATIAGKLVVTMRGTCDRIFRAVAGQKHGAAAVALIDTSPASYPPFEGTITGDPGSTIPNQLVTIPFLGVLKSDGPALTGAATVTLSANTLANPAFRKVAGFSSGGPRFGDSHLKPNVTAPGVSTSSTGVGTGTGAEVLSGTSMATPHVAGVAALTRQAHPNWSERALTAAVVQTADPAQLSDYKPRLEGAGLVQPVGATQTQAVVTAGDGRNGLSFGFEELFRDFHSSQELNVRNHGKSPIAFNVTATPTGGVPHTVSFNRTTIFLGPKDDTELKVKLEVPAATVGSTHDALGNDAFSEVAGYVTLTPAKPSMNNGVSLHLPYYLVPRVRSDLDAFLTKRLSPSKPNSEVKIVNFGGAIAGNADFYAWGLSSKRQGVEFFDTRAVGVQSIVLSAPDSLANCGVSATNSLLVFAVNTFERFSNAAAAEFDIFIDVDGDGIADFQLIGADLGALTTGVNSGQLASALFDLRTMDGIIEFIADAPTDGSTVLLPVCASDFGVTPANPRFSYSARTINLIDGSESKVPGTASFNAFSPAISNALFVPVARNKTATVPVTIDPAEFAKTPALGLMVVTLDNKAGTPQAQLIEVGRR